MQNRVPNVLLIDKVPDENTSGSVLCSSHCVHVIQSVQRVLCHNRDLCIANLTLCMPQMLPSSTLSANSRKAQKQYPQAVVSPMDTG